MPIIDYVTQNANTISIKQTPSVFGVSGYSGAGTAPSKNNDVDYLNNNFLPYKLQNHIHEREISYQLGN